MTAPAPAAPPVETASLPPERPALALAFAFAASVCFAAMGAFVRKIGHTVGTAETVCARGILGSLVLLGIHVVQRRPLRVGAPGIMVLRTLAGTASLFCYYGAIEGAASDGPGELATAVLLLKTAPVWVAVGSRAFLGEVATGRTWFALVLGIVGASLAIAKGEGVSGGRGTIMLGLMSGVCAAAAYLSVRKLAAKEEPLTVVAFFSMGAALLTAPFAALHLSRAPAWPDPSALGWLAGAALSGTTAQVLMTHAYRHARATVAAVAGLGEVGFALLAAFLIFHEEPGPWALLGGGLAVIAGFVASWPARPADLRATA